MIEQAQLQTLLTGSESVLAQVMPELGDKVYGLIADLGQIDLSFGAFMGLRTFAEQDALYDQGRVKPGKIVTKAKGGQSWHNYGLAIDLVEDGDPQQAGIQWSWKNNVNYLRIGILAEARGLEWGGFWKAFKDYPHVQLTNGLSLEDALSIQRENGIEAVWAQVRQRGSGG